MEGRFGRAVVADAFEPLSAADDARQGRAKLFVIFDDRNSDSHALDFSATARLSEPAFLPSAAGSISNVPPTSSIRLRMLRNPFLVAASVFGPYWRGRCPSSSISKVKRFASRCKRTTAAVARAWRTTFVTGFLGGKEDVVPQFWRNRGGRQTGRNVEAIIQAGHGEIFLRVFADVIDQPVESVVGRIYGPDDFVERASGFTGGLGNLAGRGLRLPEAGFCRLQPFRQAERPE